MHAINAIAITVFLLGIIWKLIECGIIWKLIEWLFMKKV
jgi:hypothetical protein